LRSSSLPDISRGTKPQLPFRNTLFQFRRNHKPSLARVIPDVKQVRSATNLAVFYIGLPAACRFIHGRLVALAAPGALESGFHIAIVGQTGLPLLPAYARPATKRL
jgi:hypothetical protein